MRTRRSWKNQDRLWKALGGKPEKPQVATPPRCWDCISYPKGGRMRGKCTLRGLIVLGQQDAIGFNMALAVKAHAALAKAKGAP